MSVVIVAGDPHVDGALARRLVAEGDTVGIVVEDDGVGERFDPGGAHVAVGSAADDDLIERAATHARTIVVFEAGARDRSRVEVVAAVVAAARRLGGVRLVVWGPDPSPRTVAIVRSSGLPYVILRTGRLHGRFRKTVPLASVVEAIDAADDLAGDVRLEVDLTDPEGWTRLRLEPPG